MKGYQYLLLQRYNGNERKSLPIYHMVDGESV